MDLRFLKLTSKRSLFENNCLAGALTYIYAGLCGVTAQFLFEGTERLFVLSSIIFSLCVIYLKDPEVKKNKAYKGLIYTNWAGSLLAISYIVIFGISSFSLLSGVKLMFFMLTYTFAFSIIYVREPKRVYRSELLKNKEAVKAPVFVKEVNFISEVNKNLMSNKEANYLSTSFNHSLTQISMYSNMLLSEELTVKEKRILLDKIQKNALNYTQNYNRLKKISSAPKEVYTLGKESQYNCLSKLKSYPLSISKSF